MTVEEGFQGVRNVFIDTAPIIYLVEGSPAYLPALLEFFGRVDRGALSAVTSPITLAECLVAPLRSGRADIASDFEQTILHAPNTSCIPLSPSIATHASRLRVELNLTLLDALQVACALESGCDAILTNDATLQRVLDVRIVLVSELEP